NWHASGLEVPRRAFWPPSDYFRELCHACPVSRTLPEQTHRVRYNDHAILPIGLGRFEALRSGFSARLDGFRVHGPCPGHAPFSLTTASAVSPRLACAAPYAHPCLVFVSSFPSRLVSKTAAFEKQRLNLSNPWKCVKSESLESR